MSFISERRDEKALSKERKWTKDYAMAEASGLEGPAMAHYKYLAMQSEDEALREHNELAKKDNKIRLPVFIIAMTMIAAGFLLQVPGTWLGGIGVLNIRP